MWSQKFLRSKLCRVLLRDTKIFVFPFCSQYNRTAGKFSGREWRDLISALRSSRWLFSEAYILQIWSRNRGKLGDLLKVMKETTMVQLKVIFERLILDQFGPYFGGIVNRTWYVKVEGGGDKRIEMTHCLWVSTTAEQWCHLWERQRGYMQAGKQELSWEMGLEN